MIETERVVLCEGYHDRAFFKGMLEFAGCKDEKPRCADPWGVLLSRGHYGFTSRSGSFVRVIPCGGKGMVLPELRIRLRERPTKPLEHVVVNIDADSDASVPADPDALSTSNVRALARNLLGESIGQTADGDLSLAGGGLISVLHWKLIGEFGHGVPSVNTLERVVCGAICSVYPERGSAVQAWLDARPNPGPVSVKAFSWSFMAGWNAEHGCEDFLTNLWRDQETASALKAILHASGAWRVVEAIAS